MEATDRSTPRDDFPPHGYLDNPYHSWKLNPSGVLRSRPPLGMGWHRPNLGSYGRNQFQDRAHLHVGVEVDGARLLTPAELLAGGAAPRCDLHTKNRLRYLLAHPAGVDLAATHFLAEEHVLGCRIELSREVQSLNAEDAERKPRTQRQEGSGFGASRESVAPSSPVRLWLALELAHNPATSRLWEHGLYAVLPGATEPATGAFGLLGVCPEGDAWALGAAQAGAPLVPTAAHIVHTPWPADDGAPAPLARDPGEPRLATLLLAYDLALAPDGAPLSIEAALARGPSSDQALARLAASLTGRRPTALAARVAEDERFWRVAPHLSGDWPAHWRRGFATDLETLRMVARPPVGVFAGAWDGMQIQAPRIVLAEAALDALALAWADPALARELLLSCFVSAARPNVPCMREDGSYNMVADDGAICGTGPEWGWPFAVIDALWRRSGDTAWLGAVYPGAAAYIRWWLTERVDAHGWPVHACSWESGQDVSTRFGEQSTGGSDVRHVRPVDLLAATAYACSLLAAWAATLGRTGEELDEWRAHADQLAERTRALWRDGWFRDFDARAGRWSDVRDPMQLAPLTCGLATDAQVAALRPAFDALPSHAGAYPPLVWPPVAHTALEAALAAGRDERAAQLAAPILDRVWRRMDARTLEPDGAVPGVTREFWPEAAAERDAPGDAAGDAPPSAGIEGYGWGALGVHFVVRYLVGLRELGPERFRLVPALPPEWRRPGARFVVGPLAHGAGRVTITYTIPDGSRDYQDDSVEIQLALADLPGAWVARDEVDGREVARGVVDRAGPVQLGWRSRWLRPVMVEAAANGEQPTAGR